MTTIGVLGAAGYTGRLVAAELAARALPHRLGGRSRERLGALPPSPDATPYVVDVTNADQLRGFFDGLDAVISCVGPFARLGLPVVDAAVEAGVPYVDSTGELAFMAKVYRRHAEAATPVVPACGFDYLPGDLAVSLAAARLVAPATEVSVSYRVSGMHASRGTVRTALGMLGTLTGAPRRCSVAFPDGTEDAVTVPWGEPLTVPRHLPGASVRTALVVRPVVAVALSAAASVLPHAQPLLDHGAALVDGVVDRLPEGPTSQQRQRTRFTVLVEVRGGEQVERLLIEGRDVYGLTASALVESALRVRGVGAMAPAQALNGREVLDALSGSTFSWRRWEHD